MISVVIITKNEEKMIKTCLESIKWADEIIIADNGSTDKTLEIVKKYTKKIIEYEGSDFAALRNQAVAEAKGDWLLYVDADERVLTSLRDEILEVVKETDKSAFALPRRNIIFGQEVSYGPYKRDFVIRLFKKSDFKQWIGRVHESVQFNGELGYTKNSLLHLTHRNIDHFILKSLEWSKIDAQLRLESGHPLMSGWRFIRIFITELWNQGIVREGFFGGTIGIIDSILQVFFFYMTYVRLWQLQQSQPLDKVYEELDQKLINNEFQMD